MDSSACQECEMIAQEIAVAYADAWAFSDQKFKEAWIVTYQMIGGTEEDAACAEETLSGFRAGPFPPWGPAVREGGGSARIREAIMRKHKHQALTGHTIPARIQ